MFHTLSMEGNNIYFIISDKYKSPIPGLSGDWTRQAGPERPVWRVTMSPGSSQLNVQNTQNPTSVSSVIIGKYAALAVLYFTALLSPPYRPCLCSIQSGNNVCSPHFDHQIIVPGRLSNTFRLKGTQASYSNFS